MNRQRGWVVGLLFLGLGCTVEVHRVHALQPSEVVLALPVIDGLRAPQGVSVDRIGQRALAVRKVPAWGMAVIPY